MGHRGRGDPRHPGAAGSHRRPAAQCSQRRGLRIRLRRRVHRDRPHTGDRTGRGPAAARPGGLHSDGPRFDGDGGTGGLCRRRRAGQGVPSGGDRRRDGLHGGARGREIPRRRGACRGRPGGRIEAGLEPAGRGLPKVTYMAMDWDKLRVFHAVAEAGSFTHAGEALNLSQSAVSRQISALEESLSVPLFHRHARGLILTEQGELLFRTAREVFAKLAMSESLISESKDRPKGPLKITTTVAFGSIWLTPRIHEFLDLYPEIQVSLVVDDTELDLSMREADVAIRMTPPRQPDLIQRHLVSVQEHIYGSPEYLKKHGMPQRADDLDDHRLIVYGDDSRPPVPGLNWLLDSGAKPGKDRRPILSVNNSYGMLRAVLSGLGLASLPDFVATDHNSLVRVLPELTGPPAEAYFVYPEELRSSKRISVFRDFLLRKVAESRLS